MPPATSHQPPATSHQPPAVLTAIFLFLFAFFCKGQSPQCGTQGMTESEYDTYLSQLSAAASSSNPVYDFPVHLTMINNANGEHPPTCPQELEGMIDLANAYFQGVFTFHLCKVTEVTNDGLYDWNASNSIEGFPALNAANFDPNAINVYLVNNITNPNLPFTTNGIGAFPISNPSNGIALRYDVLVGSTFAHELGHFFGIQHTFNGTQLVLSPGETYTPGQSNTVFTCLNTGDRICDTPADPGTTVCNNTTCVPVCNPSAVDMQGRPFTPDKTNIMSYFGCPTEHFSNEQFDAMVLSLSHPNRVFLTDSNEPECDQFTFPTIPDRATLHAHCGTLPGLGLPETFQPAPFYYGFCEILPSSTTDVCLRQAENGPTYRPDFCCNVLRTANAVNIKAVTDVPLVNGLYAPPQYDPVRGVSTFDVVDIHRHILNVQPFTSPYQFVAADINYNGQVTTYDIIELRRLILGIYDHLPANKSWRFIPDYYLDSAKFNFRNQFFNSQNPLTETSWPGNNSPNIDPNERVYKPAIGALNKSFLDQVDFAFSNPNISDGKNWSFTGIKIGDVNCSVDMSYLELIGDDPDDLTDINYGTHNCIQAGQSAELSFRLASSSVLGYQFGLAFDPNELTLNGVLPNTAISGQSLESFGLKEVRNGKLKTMWYDPGTNGLSFNNTEIFKLQITANREICDISSKLVVDEHLLDSEVINGSNGSAANTVLNISLSPKTNQHQITGISPNPFSSSITFSFNLASNENASFSIIDQYGNIQTEAASYSAGNNSKVMTPSSQIPVNSPVFYMVNLGNEVYSGSLIKN